MHCDQDCDSKKKRGPFDRHFRETRICPAPRSEGVHWLQPLYSGRLSIKRLVGGRRHFCWVLRVAQAMTSCSEPSNIVFQVPGACVQQCSFASPFQHGRPPPSSSLHPPSTLMTFLTRLPRLYNVSSSSDSLRQLRSWGGGGDERQYRCCPGPILFSSLGFAQRSCTEDLSHPQSENGGKMASRCCLCESLF
jgi:hypothetical protein